MKLIVSVISLFALFASSASLGGSPEQLAAKLFNQLSCGQWKAGDPDPRVPMAALIKQGKFKEAAALATASSGFLNCNLKRFFASWTNRAKSPFAYLNDMSATMIGHIRDDLPFNQVLYDNVYYYFDVTAMTSIPGYGNAEYQGDVDCGRNVFNVDDPRYPRIRLNAHYCVADMYHLDMADKSVFKSGTRNFVYNQNIRQTFPNPDIPPDPQPLIPVGEEAGVLTSRAFLKAHAVAGTNRRLAEKSMEEFLCMPIQALRDKTIPDYRVRQDVTRQPGANATTYLNKCRSCHAGLDGVAGAFARIDYKEAFNEATDEIYATNVPTNLPVKLFRNDTTFPEGYRAVDDTWVNQWTNENFSSLGWRGKTQGRGMKEYGTMLANSRAFSVCMAKRVLDKVCPGSSEFSQYKTLQEDLANEFEAKQYNMKRLFESAASLPECLGR